MRPKGEIWVTETWLQRAKSHKRKQWYKKKGTCRMKIRFKIMRDENTKAVE